MDSHFMVAGMRIVESTFALKDTDVPVRQHRRRRWMSERYHARIQKKWLKRFGTVREPCMYVMNPQAVGLLGGKTLICHPALMPQLRDALARQHG